MKSTISAWVLLLVALLATGCSKKKTWAEVYAVKGNVVSLTDTTWSASEKFGEVYRERMTGYTKTELNKHGQLVSQTFFDEDGHIERKMVQAWKDKYALSSIIHYNADGEVSLKMIFHYDGDKISSMVEESNEDHNETVYKYEWDGDRLSKITATKEGKTETRSYAYKDDGSCRLSVVSFDGTTSEFDLDSEERIVKCHLGEHNYSYQYAKSGLLEKYSDWNGETTYEYKFDKQGNWTERVGRIKRGKEKAEVCELVVRSVEYGQ